MKQLDLDESIYHPLVPETTLDCAIISELLRGQLEASTIGDAERVQMDGTPRIGEAWHRCIITSRDIDTAITEGRRELFIGVCIERGIQLIKRDLVVTDCLATL